MKKSRTLKATAIILLVLFGPVANSFAAAGDNPTAQIRSTVDRVIALLTDPTLQGEAKKTERHNLLQQTIFSRFDFQEMARRSLGSHWRRLTIDEQTQFVVLFKDLLEKAYLDRIQSYNKERFIYTNEQIDEPYAEVGSKILTAKGEEFSIRYRVLRAGDQWRIYDVVVEDISLVNNYRSQFNRIISKSSYAELVQTMKDKLVKHSVK